MELEELKSLCEGVKNKGWLDSVRTTGRFTGGAGQTFEYHTIGRLGDSSKEADYKGVEFKTSLDSTSARVTLFTQNPSGDNMRVLWEKLGYPCDDGKIRLYKPIKFNNDDGLRFSVENERLNVTHSDIDINSYYELPEIRNSLAQKLKTVLLAKYEKKEDQYKFTNFQIYSGVDIDNFISLLGAGTIVCETRCSGYPDGKFKDRGTAFRISKNKLTDLYSSVVRI
jgi:hypothetical protein